MRNPFLLWLVVGMLCFTTSCAPSSVTGTNHYTTLSFIAYFFFAIVVYELFLRRIAKALDKLKKKKKPAKVDLKSLELEFEHKKNELHMVEKVLKGDRTYVMDHLQGEKFEYVDLLNKSRAFAATKDLPEKDKIVAEKYIVEFEEAIMNLDEVTNLAFDVLKPEKVH